MSVPLVYRSYAKINFYLDILERRADGYHNIETIFQTVSLCDELQFIEQRGRVSLSCSIPELAVDDANLACRAAMLLKEKTSCEQGVRITLEKRIPIAAGLAGGSGNAAAALAALNQLWGLALTESELMNFALELGSDVPYCLKGGLAAATGRGEYLTPLPPLPKTWLVLIHPTIPVSTSRIYNDSRLGHSDETPVNARTPSFQNAIEHLSQGDIQNTIFNRMEEVVFAEHPQLADMKQQLLDAGCAVAAMSGSGPTLFGICASKLDATKITEKLPNHKTSVVCTVPFALERI